MTQFQVPLNGVLEYQVPPIIDERELDFEGGEAYVAADKNHQDLFPEFLSYINSTNTIVLNPFETETYGKIFYFTIVLKSTE